jgi:SAM-dependent methyltransferase
MQRVATVGGLEDLVGTGHASSRWIVFVHQDGLVLSATIRALEELGILEQSLEAERTVAELYPDVSESGFGYLRVGLRALASQGWVDFASTLDPGTAVVRWSDAGRVLAPYLSLYKRAGEFLASFSNNAPHAWAEPWTERQVEDLAGLSQLAGDRWRLDPGLPPETRALTETHLNAALLVPTMLRLRAMGRLRPERPLVDGPEPGPTMGELLASLGLLDAPSGVWTDQGRRTLAVSVHLGMTASYLPLLASLPDLYRGTRVVGRTTASGEMEWHVHRSLNVDASAAAHRRYFADADGIFLELFNREPLETQPRFIADMGCGDGSWLVHLHRLIMADTLRGQSAAKHPLLMIGVDCNDAALERARAIAGEARMPAVFIPGDVGSPDQLQEVLADHGLRIEDGLHIRAFVDHDRSYRGVDSDAEVPGWSSGAYVDENGHPLSGAAVERDLIAHLGRWVPHIRKHGLVMLEAHCVSPRIARRHLGAVHSVAFDSYHGYSHQYPIDHAAFLRCCRAAGLQPSSMHERRYPSTRPLVAVSLNCFSAAVANENLLLVGDEGGERADTWRPDPTTPLEDGKALHGLLFCDGDVRFPRMWCSAPTGQVVTAAIDAIERQLTLVSGGDAIRVLDYGAGTGLASIELIKACLDRRIDERLKQRGAAFELHLVDLPSSWFAEGFELMRGCGWTRFHALRDEHGRFRPLLEVTAGRTVDVVIANMVFHLIPQRALRRTAAELASVLQPGGTLAWSSPDLGPAGPYAMLFHDPNRQLRARWVELHARTGDKADSRLREAHTRAARRILPEAHRAADVAAALEEYFTGELSFPTFEILHDDVLDTLLVPANQREYLPEIEDQQLRERAIRELMLERILPEFAGSPAATAHGLNVQWTLGTHTRSAA